MKRYKPLFELLEGKKQAREMLRKHVSGERLEDILNSFSKYDPTAPQNKYFELFARVYISLLRSNNEVLALTKFNQSMSQYKIKHLLSLIESKGYKIDLQKIKSMQNMVDEITVKADQVSNSYSKGGISNLSDKKDYLQLKVKSRKFPNAKAYVPLTFDASVRLASSSTGNCKGFWCTSDIKGYGDKYWKEYIGEKEIILIYIVGFAGDNDKWSIALDERDRLEIFKFDGKGITENDFIDATGFNPKAIINEVRRRQGSIKTDVNPYSIDNVVKRVSRTLAPEILRVWGVDIEEALSKLKVKSKEILRIQFIKQDLILTLKDKSKILIGSTIPDKGVKTKKLSSFKIAYFL